MEEFWFADFSLNTSSQTHRDYGDKAQISTPQFYTESHVTPDQQRQRLPRQRLPWQRQQNSDTNVFQDNTILAKNFEIKLKYHTKYNILMNKLKYKANGNDCSIAQIAMAVECY